MSFEVMLDTNAVSNLLRDPKGPVSSRLRLLGEERSCVSIITAAELLFGARRVGSSRLERDLTAILSVVPPVPFEEPAAFAYADIRSALEARGTPIGPNDLFIASHALSLDLTLVTANIREFSRVPGLRVENWLD